MFCLFFFAKSRVWLLPGDPAASIQKGIRLWEHGLTQTYLRWWKLYGNIIARNQAATHHTQSRPVRLGFTETASTAAVLGTLPHSINTHHPYDQNQITTHFVTMWGQSTDQLHPHLTGGHCIVYSHNIHIYVLAWKPRSLYPQCIQHPSKNAQVHSTRSYSPAPLLLSENVWREAGEGSALCKGSPDRRSDVDRVILFMGQFFPAGWTRCDISKGVSDALAAEYMTAFGRNDETSTLYNLWVAIHTNWTTDTSRRSWTAMACRREVPGSSAFQ